MGTKTIQYLAKYTLLLLEGDTIKSKPISDFLVWLCEPVSAWLTENAVAIKSLERLLGEVRKIEKQQENRTYIVKTGTAAGSLIKQ